ncbi:MAG TPA: hypothetical protein VKR78_07295 [Acidimicrobiales bacterium]|nr:hypothetical protein [Acidimicrobiales bacterium]
MAVSVRFPEAERTSSRLGALIEACREARAALGRASLRSTSLCERALAAQRRSVEARLASRSRARYALVEGIVDGRSTTAIVYCDGTVVGVPALVDRVGLVVSLGDTFGDEEMKASIGRDPLISTLTTVRAYDRVSSIDVFGPLAERRPAPKRRDRRGFLRSPWPSTSSQQRGSS